MKKGGDPMKRHIILFLFIFSFLCLGATNALAATIEYGSNIGTVDNHVVGYSYTGWQDQGIFTDGSVTGTLYIYTNGKWVVNQSQTETGSGSNDWPSVSFNGYSSGYWYYEGGVHTGDFWSSTKYSTSGQKQCP